METKKCSHCAQVKPESAFCQYTTRRGVSRIETVCKICRMNARKQNPSYKGHTSRYNHKTGKCLPLDKSKDSACYLGVYVAERALSRFFDNIERMPYGNPGYDFLCGKGFKIDVKSGCLLSFAKTATRWIFTINYNSIADFFLCISFDNREQLNPLHVWLIPGYKLSQKKLLSISNSDKSLKKWTKYEKPLDKARMCCEKLHGGNK